MPAVHGKNASFKVQDSGGTLRDLTPQLTEQALSELADLIETSAFGAVWKAKIAGLRDANGSAGGNFDAVTDGYLSGIVGMARTFEFFPNGTTTGCVKRTGSLIVTSYTTNSSVSDASKFDVSFEVDGAITRTVVA